MTGNVIIVGAPRSGTNMLRDALTSVPGIATWPCDEIPLIWRHGNLGAMSDELTSAQVTPAITGYLRNEFAKIGKRNRAHTVVEKTCATSLRVGFVAKSFPDAKYIFIRRDGIDTAASAMQRWDAKFDLRYTARKAMFIPPTDIVHYGRRFLASQLGNRRRKTNPPTSAVTGWWGPKPHDYRQLMQQHSLDELCFIQWQRCVEASMTELSQIPADQRLEVAYEEFVADPVSGLGDVLRFMGHETTMDSSLVTEVSSRSVGKGRSALGARTVAKLEAIGGHTLAKLGYA